MRLRGVVALVLVGWWVGPAVHAQDGGSPGLEKGSPVGCWKPAEAKKGDVILWLDFGADETLEASLGAGAEGTWTLEQGRLRTKTTFGELADQMLQIRFVKAGFMAKDQDAGSKKPYSPMLYRWQGRGAAPVGRLTGLWSVRYPATVDEPVPLPVTVRYFFRGDGTFGAHTIVKTMASRWDAGSRMFSLKGMARYQYRVDGDRLALTISPDDKAPETYVWDGEFCGVGAGVR